MTLGAVEHFLTYAPFKYGVTASLSHACFVSVLVPVSDPGDFPEDCAAHTAVVGGCWRGNGCKLHDTIRSLLLGPSSSPILLSHFVCSFPATSFQRIQLRGVDFDKHITSRHTYLPREGESPESPESPGTLASSPIGLASWQDDNFMVVWAIPVIPTGHADAWHTPTSHTKMI